LGAEELYFLGVPDAYTLTVLQQGAVPGRALRAAAECCRLAETHCDALAEQAALTVAPATLPPLRARLLAALAVTERRAAERVAVRAAGVDVDDDCGNRGEG